MSKNLTTIVCIRHGESLANVFIHEAGKTSDYSKEMTEKINSVGDDPQMSDKGRDQAVKTAQHLREALKEITDETFVMIYTSPMIRAQQTLAPFIAAGEPFHGKKITIKEEMVEFDRKTQKSVKDFVTSVVLFFKMLERKATIACEDQHIFLFGHSLFFSVFLHVVTMHRPEISTDELINLVAERCCDEKNNFINVAFHLPNCSISSVQAEQKNGETYWKILGVGKADHLPLDIRTGHHSLF